jgi:hypothetical protein
MALDLEHNAHSADAQRHYELIPAGYLRLYDR